MSAPPKALAIISTSYSKESTNCSYYNKIDLIIHKYIAGSSKLFFREKQVLSRFSVLTTKIKNKTQIVIFNLKP